MLAPFVIHGLHLELVGLVLLFVLLVLEDVVEIFVYLALNYVVKNVLHRLLFVVYDY